MIKYIYVPESENISEYYQKANELGAVQIIQGESDIISDFIEDYEKPSIIEIPQFTGLFMPTKTFPEKSNIEIIFVDEWIKQNNYNSLDCNIYLLDIDKPWIQTLYKTIKLKYDQSYSFFGEFTAESYGEYIIEIIANYDNEQKNIYKDEIIIYREYQDKIIEENNDFKFEL